MMAIRHLSVALSILLLLTTCFSPCHGWNSNHGPVKPRAWHKTIQKVATNAAVATTIYCGIMLPHDAAFADASSSFSEEQLRQSLKPATESRPQIMLQGPPPTQQQYVPIENQPIVQGLLSLSNPKSEIRPAFTDTIVITIRDYTQPDTVLGGARIPVSKARFPLAFRLYPKNILANQQATWNEKTSQGGDVLVKAWLCPEENPKCSETESRMQAAGVAKLIRNLPGLATGETIRAPASLSLQ
ncbi:expressed unknown protein [Seminavis robusta]|uniref:Uncharacterized protein n=1 Tax=Seminavis robusta TaxID=568900 RepID=A0A9N8H7N9_9STRA|nr:expressed unknown protein [Seminavis robusta]|eukprot:Sro210_g087640.1 n/a (243) ;mRNA; f:45321-46149